MDLNMEAKVVSVYSFIKLISGVRRGIHEQMMGKEKERLSVERFVLHFISASLSVTHCLYKQKKFKPPDSSKSD